MSTQSASISNPHRLALGFSALPILTGDARERNERRYLSPDADEGAGGPRTVCCWHLTCAGGLVCLSVCAWSCQYNCSSLAWRPSDARLQWVCPCACSASIHPTPLNPSAENIRWSVMGVLSVLPLINPMVGGPPSAPVSAAAFNPHQLLCVWLQPQRTSSSLLWQKPVLRSVPCAASLAISTSERSTVPPSQPHVHSPPSPCVPQAWVFAALDDEEASTLYWSFACLYALPYLVRARQLGWRARQAGSFQSARKRISSHLPQRATLLLHACPSTLALACPLCLPPSLAAGQRL